MPPREPGASAAREATRRGAHGPRGPRVEAVTVAPGAASVRAMTEKSWGKTVLGWFVVQEGTADAAPADDLPADDADRLIAKYAAAAPAPEPPVVLSGPLPPVVDGHVDFDAVFDQAGVDATARGRIAQARQLLGNLPAETPILVKRQIVDASLKAFGVPTDEIIEAGVASIEALESYNRTGQSQTQGTLSAATEQIAELEQRIAALKADMQASVATQEQRARAANEKKLEVQKVLEFFGADAVHQVVVASPKLHEPR